MGASLTADMANPIISQVGVDVGSGAVQGLSVGTTYYVGVRAINFFGHPTAWAVAGSGKTDSSVAAPTIVPPVSSSMTYVDVTWTDLNPPGTTFEVLYNTGTVLNITATPQNVGSVLSWRFIPLTPNTTYSFGDDKVANKGYTTIWDTGGTDTIAYTGTGRARIDLDAATLQRDIGGGGLLSTSETFTGGFLIANGVVIEKAIGGSNDDILIGNSAANTLTGNGGNDFLNGGNGADRLIGGAGDDYYIVANTGDTVTEASNAGFDQVESTVTFTLGSNVEDLFLRGASAINGTGNSSATTSMAMTSSIP